MPNLTEALAKLQEIESFMRRRYLYNHPIFASITRAIELLEAEVAAQTPPPLAEPEETAVEPETSKDEAAVESTEEPIQPDIEVPPEASKRRQNRRRGGKR